MIKAQAKGCCSSAYDLFSGDEQVASFEHGWWREGATLSVGGESYRIEAASRWGRGPFRLLLGDEVILEATVPSIWKSHLVVDIGGDVLDLRPKSFTLKTWFLTDSAGTTRGRIERESWWSRRAVVDMPDGTPLSVQAFLLCLVVFMWNRQMAAAS